MHTHRLKSILKIAVVAALTVTITACSQRKTDDDDAQSFAEADSIFHESVKLTRQYIKHLESLPDTMDVASVVEEYESKLTALNLQGSPMVDKYMSESQNDSLNLLQQQFLDLAHRKMEVPKPEVKEETDSVTP